MTDLPDLDNLEKIARAATPGRWEWQTGSSWRRLATDDEATCRRHGHNGNVLRPTNHHIDRHPDCDISQRDQDYIAAMYPQTALRLVAEIRRLRAEIKELNEPPTLCEIAGCNAEATCGGPYPRSLAKPGIRSPDMIGFGFLCGPHWQRWSGFDPESAPDLGRTKPKLEVVKP